MPTGRAREAGSLSSSTPRCCSRPSSPRRVTARSRTPHLRARATWLERQVGAAGTCEEPRDPLPLSAPGLAPGTLSPQSLQTIPPAPVSSLGAPLGVRPPSALAAFSGVCQEAPALQTNASMSPEASSSKTLSSNSFNVKNLFSDG